MTQIVIVARRILSYSPYVYVCALYSFVIRATIKLGYIPYYNNPDPQTLNFHTHQALLTVALKYQYGE